MHFQQEQLDILSTIETNSASLGIETDVQTNEEQSKAHPAKLKELRQKPQGAENDLSEACLSGCKISIVTKFLHMI